MQLHEDTGEWSNYCNWQGPNSHAPSSGQARESTFGVKRTSEGGPGSQQKAWGSGSGSGVAIVDNSGRSIAVGGAGEAAGGGVTGFPHHPGPLTPSPQAAASSSYAVAPAAAAAAASRVSVSTDGEGGFGTNSGGNAHANAAAGEVRQRRRVSGSGDLSAAPPPGFGAYSGGSAHANAAAGEIRQRKSVSGSGDLSAAPPACTGGVVSGSVSSSPPSRSEGLETTGGAVGVRGDGSDPNSPPPKPPDQLGRSRKGAEGGAARAGEELPVELPGLGLARSSSR